jgi:hypothetical protein
VPYGTEKHDYSTNLNMIRALSRPVQKRFPGVTRAPAAAILVLGVSLALALAPAASVAISGSPAAAASGNGCASEHNPAGIRLWIHVTRWCIVPGVRRQAQLKVQMRIHNQSDQRLYIGQDRIRVILRRFDPDDWSPAQIGQPTLDRPIQTTYRGEQVWAVPANADGSYDVFPHKPEPTHATHWPESQLGPKDTLNPHFHYGDLVYHVPIPHPRPADWSVIGNVVGIAYIKGRDIIALCPPSSWGEHAPAGTF